MDNIKWLELFTICFGLFCVALSLVLSYRFHLVKQSLSKALSIQLMAEGFVGFVTVLFAITSWLDLYSNLSPELVLVMRISIFTAASSTSINLYRKVRHLESNQEDSEDE
jgi:hypothetical protein